MNNKANHLNMIQSAMTRMSSNSFLLKTWTVTLMAALFTLSRKDTDQTYFLIALVPIITFAGLDAYYLQQERLFRKVYDKVRLQEEKNIDYSMDYTGLGGDKERWLPNCIRSKTISFFYSPLLLITILVTIYNT